MIARDGSDYLELSDYVRVIRRRWLIITVVTLIGFVAAGGYYIVAPKTYAATALVQVSALPTDVNAIGGRTSGPVNMDNESQIVQSASVAAIVKAQLHSTLSVTDLIKAIHVAVPPNTTFLQISCDAGTARAAPKCANATARAYLLNRRNSALTLVTSAINAMNARVLSLQSAVQHLETRLAKNGLAAGSPSRIIDRLQLEAGLSRLSTIQARLGALTPLHDSLATTNSDVAGKIVTPAITPAGPASPRALLLLPSGVAAGLAIGLAGAFLADRRRPRVHSGRDVERIVDAPAVVNLAHAKGIGTASIAPPTSEPGQALAELAQYAAAALGAGSHVLLVAGTAPGWSGSVVAANLACALATTRDETVLVFAQRGGTPVPRLLGGIGARGYAELLAGSAALSDVARRVTAWPRLRVIGSGNDACVPAVDLRFDKVRDLICDLREDARYVVIDAQSTGAGALALGMAEFADAAIVVVQAEASRVADVTHFVQRLGALRTTVLGTVIMPSRSRLRAGEHVSRPPVPAGAGADPGRSGAPASAPEHRDVADIGRQPAAVAVQAWTASPVPWPIHISSVDRQAP